MAIAERQEAPTVIDAIPLSLACPTRCNYSPPVHTNKTTRFRTYPFLFVLYVLYSTTTAYDGPHENLLRFINGHSADTPPAIVQTSLLRFIPLMTSLSIPLVSLIPILNTSLYFLGESVYYN